MEFTRTHGTGSTPIRGIDNRLVRRRSMTRGRAGTLPWGTAIHLRPRACDLAAMPSRRDGTPKAGLAFLQLRM